MCKSYTPSQNFSKNIRLRHRWLKVLLWEPNVIKLTYCGNVCHYIQLTNHQFRTLKSSFYDGQMSWFILSVENDGIVLNGLNVILSNLEFKQQEITTPILNMYQSRFTNDRLVNLASVSYIDSMVFEHNHIFFNIIKK